MTLSQKSAFPSQPECANAALSASLPCYKIRVLAKQAVSPTSVEFEPQPGKFRVRG